MPKILLSLFVVVLLATDVSGQVNFRKDTYFTFVTYPDHTAKADFNGDGITDIAAAGEYGISVVYSSTNGKPALTTFSGKFNWGLISAGDYDGDGDVDLVSNGYDSLFLLANDGTGNFIPSKGLVILDPGTNAMTSADFNNDGKDDLVVSSYFTEKIKLLNGTATGFSSPVISTGTNTGQIKHGDFNGDAKEDLVAMNENSFSILINSGNGLFTNTATYPTPTYPTCTVVADVDGDNRSDIIIGNGTGTSSSITVHKNGTTGFTLLKTYLKGDEFTSPEFVSVGDFDGDNDADMVYVDWTEATISIRENDGHGDFAEAAVIPLGGQPRTVNTGDFNNDGLIDITVGNYFAVQTLFNNGNGSFSNPVIAGSGSPTGLVQADFNEDGSADIAISNGNTNSISIMLNDQQGRFPDRVDIPLNQQPDGIASGNLIGSSHEDLVVVNINDDNISVFEGDGKGNFTTPKTFPAGDKPFNMLLADFNGDEHEDILINNLDGIASILINTGNGFDAPEIIALPTGIGFSIVKTGDVNGDELPDLVFASQYSFFNRNLYMMINAGDGTFNDPEEITSLDYELEGLCSCPLK